VNPQEFSHIAQSERELWWYRGMRGILDAALEPHLKGRTIRTVLEGGCGTGYQSLVMSRRYGWQMTPLDYSYVGLRHARGYGLDRLVQGDLGALPFCAASFDAVLSLDVVVHFPRGREQSAFDEMARVLKPGGLLVIRVSALDLLRSRHSMHAEERQRFTRPHLVDGVERAGIRVDRCTYINSLLMPVAVFKFRIWEPLTRAAPASGVDLPPPWLNRLLELPLRAEQSWVGRGGSFPCGQSLLLIGTRLPCA
jgi:SAM-dependent methyltransferase